MPHSGYRPWIAAALLALVGVPAAAQEGACPEGRVGTVELIRALGTAEAYFSSLNVEGFSRATDEAQGFLPCIDEAVPRTLAAEIHRFQGIRAFVDRDLAAAERAFAAARSIEPDYAFPAYLVPPGNPLLDHYGALDPTTGSTRELGEPEEGRLQFDGTPSLERPTDWPTLAQHFDDKGGVLTTAYLEPGDVIFTYELKRRRLFDTRLMAIGGASAVVSSVFWLAALQVRAAYDDPTRPHEELPALRDQVNALSSTSTLFGLTAIGFGTWSVLKARRE